MAVSSLGRYVLVYVASLIVCSLFAGRGEAHNSMIAMLIMAFFLTIPCLALFALFDFVELHLMKVNAGLAIFIVAPALGYFLPILWSAVVMRSERVDWGFESLSGAGLIGGLLWTASSLFYDRRARAK